MRILPAVALVLASVAMPVLAQHGGGAHGGFSGGGHASGGGFHGGFAGSSGRGGSGGSGTALRSSAPRPGTSYAARPGFGSTSRFRSPAGLNARTGAYPGRGFAGPVSAARPAFYSRAGAGLGTDHRGGGRYPFRGNRLGYGYGYPGLYGYNLVYNPFFFDPLWGFGDPFWDADNGFGPDANLNYNGYGSYDGLAPQQQAAAPDPGQPYPGQSSDGYPNPPANGYAPSPENEPGPWAPQMYREPASAPRQERAVTILFKDGRPAEQVRNYALTRSALLITGAQMREIPLDEIDLPATERVNRAAGLDFHLPQSY